MKSRGIVGGNRDEFLEELKKAPEEVSRKMPEKLLRNILMNSGGISGGNVENFSK